MNEMQINKIKKRADEYATSCFPYEEQFIEREAVVKCCVHVVTETIAELEQDKKDKVVEHFEAYGQCRDSRRIADLEAQIEKMKNWCNCKNYQECLIELAELKSFRQDCVKLTEDNVVMARQRAEIANQLTKAKEIIKELMKSTPYGVTKLSKDAYDKAEQFLSEVE